MSAFKGLCISYSAVVSSIWVFKFYGKLFDGVAIGATQIVSTIIASLVLAMILAWPSGIPISRWYQNSWRFWIMTLDFMSIQFMAVLMFLDERASQTQAYKTTFWITMFMTCLLWALAYPGKEKPFSQSAKT